MIDKLIRYFILLAIFSTHMAYAYEAKNSTKLKEAIQKRHSGYHWQAVNILSDLRKEHISHKRVNIELILNFIKLREYDQAESILLYIQSLSLNELEQQKLDKLKQILVKRTYQPISSHRWITDVGVSIGHDVINNTFSAFEIDNAQTEDDTWLNDDINDQLWENAEFDEFDDYNNNDIISREDETVRETSNYTAQFLNINYRFRPLDNLSWFNEPTQFIWDTNASLEFRQIDVQQKKHFSQYGINSSIYLLRPNAWLIELNTKVNYHYSNNNLLLTDSRQRITAAFPLQKHKIKFAYDYGQKHYTPTLSDNNAKITTPWVEYAYALNEKIRWSIGSKYKRLSANDEFLSYRSTTLYTGINYYPSTQLSAYFLISLSRLKYVIDDTELVEWSKETKKSLSTSLKYHWNENISVRLNGHYTINKIERGLSEDDQKRIELSLIYRF